MRMLPVPRTSPVTVAVAPVGEVLPKPPPRPEPVQPETMASAQAEMAAIADLRPASEEMARNNYLSLGPLREVGIWSEIIRLFRGLSKYREVWRLRGRRQTRASALVAPFLWIAGRTAG